MCWQVHVMALICAYAHASGPQDVLACISTVRLEDRMMDYRYADGLDCHHQPAAPSAELGGCRLLLSSMLSTPATRVQTTAVLHAGRGSPVPAWQQHDSAGDASPSSPGTLALPGGMIAFAHGAEALLESEASRCGSPRLFLALHLPAISFDLMPSESRCWRGTANWSTVAQSWALQCMHHLTAASAPGVVSWQLQTANLNTKPRHGCHAAH